jgi:hypothetical protein
LKEEQFEDIIGEEAENRRRTENTMTKRKKKRQAIANKHYTAN